MCVSLCTTAVHNTTQNSSANFPHYLPDSHHSSDDVCCRCVQVPPYCLFFMCCASYRVHSIYVLRLFNDPVAMLFLYAAVNLFLSDQWAAGCLFYRLVYCTVHSIFLSSPCLVGYCLQQCVRLCVCDRITQKLVGRFLWNLGNSPEKSWFIFLEG